MPEYTGFENIVETYIIGFKEASRPRFKGGQKSRTFWQVNEGRATNIFIHRLSSKCGVAGVREAIEFTILSRKTKSRVVKDHLVNQDPL